MVEGAVRFHRLRLWYRSTLRLELCGQKRRLHLERAAPESLAIDVRRMSTDASSNATAGRNDAFDGSRIPCMTAARDVNDVGKGIQLFRLVSVFATVEIEPHVATIPHRP